MKELIESESKEKQRPDTTQTIETLKLTTDKVFQLVSLLWRVWGPVLIIDIQYVFMHSLQCIVDMAPEKMLSLDYRVNEVLSFVSQTWGLFPFGTSCFCDPPKV